MNARLFLSLSQSELIEIGAFCYRAGLLILIGVLDSIRSISGGSFLYQYGLKTELSLIGFR